MIAALAHSPACMPCPAGASPVAEVKQLATTKASSRMRWAANTPPPQPLPRVRLRRAADAMSVLSLNLFASMEFVPYARGRFHIVVGGGGSASLPRLGCGACCVTGTHELPLPRACELRQSSGTHRGGSVARIQYPMIAHSASRGHTHRTHFGTATAHAPHHHVWHCDNIRIPHAPVRAARWHCIAPSNGEGFTGRWLCGLCGRQNCTMESAMKHTACMQPMALCARSAWHGYRR